MHDVVSSGAERGRRHKARHQERPHPGGAYGGCGLCLNVLNPQIGMRHDDFVIGRDTGQDEFPGHTRSSAMRP